MKALVTLSSGDMRRALNILQVQSHRRHFKQSYREASQLIHTFTQNPRKIPFACTSSLPVCSDGKARCCSKLWEVPQLYPMQ